MSRLLHKRPAYVNGIGKQCLKYRCQSGQETPLHRRRTDRDLRFWTSPCRVSLRSGDQDDPRGERFDVGVNKTTIHHTKYSRSRAEAFQVGESTGALLEIGMGEWKKHMQGDGKSGISQLTADTGAWRTRHLRLRSAKLREVIQSPDEPCSVSHCSGLELGADDLTKPLQGQAFTCFPSLIGMMEDEPDLNISKVVGPTSSSSSTASNGFNKALTGFGAAVPESEPLVLCGLALVTVSLYRQQHGHPGEHGLHHHGQGLLPGIQIAEGSKSQPDISKEKIKSLKTTRLAQRPHKEHIDGQPQKGIWMKRRIHPIHKAEPARQMVSMKKIVVIFFRVWGE